MTVRLVKRRGKGAKTASERRWERDSNPRGLVSQSFSRPFSAVGWIGCNGPELRFLSTSVVPTGLNRLELARNYGRRYGRGCRDRRIIGSAGRRLKYHKISIVTLGKEGECGIVSRRDSSGDKGQPGRA